MSCPVCSHTMQNLGSPERRIFWCPKCGTLKEYTGDFSRVELPANLRRVIEASRIREGRINESQHATVNASFIVAQKDHDHPLVEQMIFGADGRRIS